MADIEKMAAQLDETISIATTTLDEGWADDFKAQRLAQVACNRLEAAIDRIALPGSTYAKQLAYVRDEPLADKFDEVYSIAVALRDDLKAGWIASVVELVHADTYSDYLEMAMDLLEAGYKDPAAVITGTSLEVHVRALCAKHGVDTQQPNGGPKKAGTMNDDLKKADVYDGLQQKQITAWMDLRNKAAHGEYGSYDAPQVRLFINGVRDFMTRHPA